MNIMINGCFLQKKFVQVAGGGQESWMASIMCQRNYKEHIQNRSLP